MTSNVNLNADPIASSPGMGCGKHLPVLDGIRGVAILMVLVCHFTHLEPFPSTLKMLFGSGAYGVDLFFVLSGFLITGILLDSKGKPNYFRNFYARRTLRIVPLYYVAVILVAFVLPSIAPATDGFWQASKQGRRWALIYMANIPPFWTKEFLSPTLGHFWSLSVEEHFYLVWPVAVLFLSSKALIRLCFSMMLLAMTSRIILLSLGGYEVALALFTLCRMDGLLIGSFLAIVIRNTQQTSLLIRWNWLILTISCVLVICELSLAAMVPELQFAATATTGVIVAVFFGASLAFAITRDPESILATVISHPVFRFFGLYSYGLYVMHVPLLNYFWSREVNVWSRELVSTSYVGSGLFVGLCFVVSILLAMASYHLLERRFLELKRYFGYSGRVGSLHATRCATGLERNAVAGVP